MPETKQPDGMVTDPGSPSVRRGRPAAQILHLLCGQERGGILRVVNGACEGLAPELGEVSVLVLDESPLSLPPGVRVIRFRGARNWDWRKLTKTVEFARQGGFDVVHTHNVISNLYGWAIRSRVRGVAHVVHVHSHLSHVLAESQKSWLKRALLLRGNMRALKKCDRVIAVADSVREYLVWRDLDPRKIDVIHNAVDLARIEAAAREVCPVTADLLNRTRPAASSRDGGRDRLPVIASIGRLSPVKNHRLLLEAARIVLQHERVMFVVVGDGPERASLERLAREAGVAEHVMFVGWLENPYPLLSAADLLVLTSKSEGLPIAVLEAMALRKPVVATRVGGVSEVIRDGVSGDLVEPGNPEVLAAALARMLADSRRRMAFGLAGREIVEKEFSHDAMVRKLGDVYRSLLDGGTHGEVPQAAGR